jgi:sulfate permease, SulP family
VDASQELVALGAANAATGLSQGFSVGASGSRTAVADSMGVRTQVSGLLAAGVILLILLFLTGPIADLPKAVLGATIVSAAIGLIDGAAWRELWRADRVEVAIAGVTTAGVLISGGSRRSRSPSASPSSMSYGGAPARTTPCLGG